MQGDPENKIQVEVLGITEASRPEMYALILAEKGGEGRRIPVVIGLPEAQSIAVRLQGIRSPRPLTHDIFMTMALSFQIEMVEAIVYKFDDGVFFSQVVCRQDSKVIYIDSRTSDAIALALRFNAPIYTYESVLKYALKPGQCNIVNTSSEEKEKEEEEEEETTYKDANREQLESLDGETLKHLMDKAIKEENYEQASIIRDILNTRK